MSQLENSQEPSRKRKATKSGMAKVAIAKTTSRKDVSQDKKIKQIESRLRWLQPDLKAYSVNGSAFSDYNGTVISPLPNISTGAGGSSRIGSKITITRIRFRGHSGFTTNYVWRWLMVLDKHGNAALPTDILATVGGTSIVDSLPNYGNFDVQKSEGIFLVDKRVGCQASTPGLLEFDWIPKYPLVVEYDAGGAVVKNEIRFLHCTDHITSTPTINYNYRIYYTDT